MNAVPLSFHNAEFTAFLPFSQHSPRSYNSTTPPETIHSLFGQPLIIEVIGTSIKHRLFKVLSRTRIAELQA